MKKIIATMITTMMLGSTVLGGTIPKVNVNDMKIMLQNSPFIENGSTYIPLRSVADNLGITVEWDKNSMTAILTQGSNVIKQTVNDTTAYINNKAVELGSPAKLVNGITYVPVRFVAEAFGGTVNYDQSTNTIDITYDMPATADLDMWGRIKRTDNLPNNMNEYAYVLKGVPNEMYESPLFYNMVHWLKTPVEGEDIIRPKNIMDKRNIEDLQYINDDWVLVPEEEQYTADEVKAWQNIIEKHMDLQFNANYQTINQDWVTAFTNTIAYNGMGYEKYENERKNINDYAYDLIKNKVTITGDYYVEPSILYRKSIIQYMRAWVRFKVNSPTASSIKLRNGQFSVYTNCWYEGYIDYEISERYVNAYKEINGVTYDNGSETIYGVNPRASTNLYHINKIN